MSADELITELRRLGDATPIILASGYDAHELSQRFVGRGLAAFLQRPYHLEELHATALEIVASASRDRL